jgi:hypothetical protein
MLFGIIKDCRLALASLFGLVGLLALAAGCNESSSAVDSKAAPPKLALAAADKDATATADKDAAQSDVDLKAIQKEFNASLEAWDAGKPFDFKPVVEGLRKSLAGGLDEQNYSTARMDARILEMTGSYDQARQVYAAMDAAGAKDSETEMAARVREIAKMGLTRLDWIGKAPKIEGAIFGGEKLCSWTFGPLGVVRACENCPT